MPGTYEGGKQAARQNKANYGEDFYRVIGAIGGFFVVLPIVVGLIAGIYAGVFED